jgi:hypothetical protein
MMQTMSNSERPQTQKEFQTEMTFMTTWTGAWAACRQAMTISISQRGWIACPPNSKIRLDTWQIRFPEPHCLQAVT